MHLRILLLLSLFWPFAGAASTLRALDLGEVTDRAELIFEGVVTGTRVITGTGKRSIHTEVTFRVLDMIKGQVAGDTLTLTFLGGDNGHARLQVTDSRIPRMGEHGLYFVQSLRRPLVNPLVGWHQGHYLVQRDAVTGRLRVTTVDGRPVYGLERHAPRTDRVQAGVSRAGGAGGVRLRPAGVEPPLGPDDFKRALRNLLEVRP